MKSLAEAAQSGNGPEIIARSDLPRVKRPLVDQIVRAYLERQGAKRPLKPMELMLANTYGASIRGGGEDIASIVADVNRWERPMQKLNDLSRSPSPLDPDGTLIAEAPARAVAQSVSALARC